VLLLCLSFEVLSARVGHIPYLVKQTALVEHGGAIDQGQGPCNGYLEYPFEKMTISSFPPISILAKWNSMKEDAREFFLSFQRNSLNSTRKTHASLLNSLREAMREMY